MDILVTQDNKWQLILNTLHDASFKEKQTSTGSNVNNKANIIEHRSKC